MAKRRNKQRHNGKKKAHGAVSTHSAPGQGQVGSTVQWNLRQVVPIFLPANTQLGRNYFVQIIAGPAGFRVEILEDGTLQPIGASFGGLYGAATGQFDDLQRLWASYRVNKVTATFNPSSTFQLGSLSPTLSIVDVLGGSDDADFPGTLGWYSRSKNLKIHEAYSKLSRSVTYGNWLVQCVNKPYLRTDIGGRVRESYEADDIVRLPGIQMGFTFTPSQNVSASSSGYLVGYLDVEACMEFRGRRLDEPYQAATMRSREHPFLSIGHIIPSESSVTRANSMSGNTGNPEPVVAEDLSVSDIQRALKSISRK